MSVLNRKLTNKERNMENDGLEIIDGDRNVKASWVVMRGGER